MADPKQISNAVARVFGIGYTAEVSKECVVSVVRGDDIVGFLAFISVPIPNQEAEENADKNILWPNGKDEASAHRSHVVVTSFGGGDQTPIQSAITVSRLALVALDAFDGLGVYWGDACVSNSRQVFEGYCQDISNENLAVPVWLRFQLVLISDEEVGLYTLGMSQFGLMEIEVDSVRMEVQDLFGFVSNVADYLIHRGPVIADGNTVGGSENERISVRHRASMIDEERSVYKIVFESK